MTSQGLLVLLGLVAAVAGKNFLPTWFSSSTDQLSAGEGCVAPFVPVGGKCLHIEFGEQGQGMSWQSAREYCQALGGTDFSSDLASFPTCDQYTQFARYMVINAPTNASIWMGAHSYFSPNMWEWVTMEALQTGVPFWAYVEDFQAEEECAASDGNFYYRLIADSCDQTKGFACTYTPEATVEAKRDHQVNPIIQCPHEGIQIGDYCYVFSDFSRAFDDAEHRCRNEHAASDGELYFPSDCHEFGHMAHHLEAAEDIRSYWVGAIDVTGEDEWTWVNGGLVPGGLPFWAAGEPTHHPESSPREHCAVMSREERFYLKDTPCKDKFHYICKLNVV